jgi:hypothetical protein
MSTTDLGVTDVAILRRSFRIFGVVALACLCAVTLAVASPAGDSCRKEICSSAMSSCLRADEKLNPLARTAAEKQTYCATFFTGCMSRSVAADVPWYTPEMVARFLQCPP